MIALKITLKFLFLLVFFSSAANALSSSKPSSNKKNQSITIAAASDLKFVMDEIIESFLLKNQNINIKKIYGSSGKFYHQIINQAPFDIYFSADNKYPKLLIQQGAVEGEASSYAFGRLVLFSNSLSQDQITFKNLQNSQIKKIAIANPRHAPYGMRAVESLKYAQVFPDIKDKLVYGDNIAHTAQFIQTKNAQIGIIALALVKNPNLQKGHFWLIPKSWHQPIEQTFIVTNYGKKKSAVFEFIEFFQNEQSHKILKKYGFELPN